MIAEILRLVAMAEMIAERDEQIAVGGLRDAAAIVIAARQRPVLAEDHLDLVELGAAPSTSVARATAVRPPLSARSA